MNKPIESLDRRIHPAKVILRRIYYWIHDLIWPEVVYGIDRSDKAMLGNIINRHDNHLWSSECEVCIQRSSNIDPRLKEDIKNIGSFWKKEDVVWLTGYDKNE